MNARDQMLGGIRTALGPAQSDAAPPVLLNETVTDVADLCVQFREALTALGGTVVEVDDLSAARAWLGPIVAGRRVAASPAPILKACGIAAEFCARPAPPRKSESPPPISRWPAPELWFF